MGIVKTLKRNRFTYQLGRNLRLCLEEMRRQLSGYYTSRIRSNDEEGVTFEKLGNISLVLNPEIPYEKRLLFDSEEELNWLHSIKMLLSEESKVLFIEPKSVLIPLFISKNIKCAVNVKTEHPDSLKRRDLSDSEISYEADGSIDSYDLVFVEDFNLLSEINFSQAIVVGNSYDFDKIDLNFISRFEIYKNIEGRYFPLEKSEVSKYRTDFFLVREKPLYDKSIYITANDSRNKISSTTYLRSPEIYPFDLCYASVLDVADEFIFGLDKVLPKNDEETHKERARYVERFLDELPLEHRKKVRLEYFDFCERFNRELNIPAKWLVDVSNSLLDRSKYENIVFVQADEMYHEKNHEQILQFSRQDKLKALHHEFLHFMFDLEHIRNPATVAYTHARRVFKRDHFSNTGDGCFFIPLSGRKTVPVEEFSDYPIYHLGYVIDFRKKMDLHLSEGGLFDFNEGRVDEKSWIYDADIISWNNSLPKFLGLKDRISSSKVEPFLSKMTQGE